jgi:predicted transcriptional regulator
METTSYILKEFKPFSLFSKVSEIKTFFIETSFSHFPIVKNNELIGLISESDMEEIEDDENEIGNFQYLYKLFSIEEEDSLLDILGVFASNNTNLIPVINNKKEYIGYFEINDILQIYNETPFLKGEGIVLLIEKGINEYSISEICQIVESNKGKILGVFIAESGLTSVKISIKFNAPDINEIIQSFRRYDYLVLSNHKEDYFIEDLKDRSNYLQKYLNI